MASAPPVLDPDALRPYASFAILRYEGPDITKAALAAMTQLRRMAERESKVREVEVLGVGLPEGWLAQNVEVLPVDAETGEAVQTECDAIAVRVTKTASWAKLGAPFIVVADELGYVVQRGDLVALHCPRSQVDALQRWLDGDPRPAFKRVRGAILQIAFLRGEARGLWLKGTHRRQSTKADAKNLIGVSLGDALSPFDDSSFALTSGRAKVGEDLSEIIDGTIGTTPRKAWVWNGQAESLSRLVEVALETLHIVADVIASPPSDLPFPELAVELDSLTGVAAAVDAYISEPDEVRQLPDADDDLVEASEILNDVVIDVVGDSSSPNFTLVVGPDGSEIGRLRCVPSLTNDRVSMQIGIEGSPTDGLVVGRIRDALGTGELLNVHYDTGHVLARNGLTKVNTLHQAFRNWEFVDLTGFDVRKEKPSSDGAQEIHNAIGTVGENSLFSWVAQRFSDGFLTCDDGSNEVADFVHLDSSGLLTLIHVKAAGKATSHRVATGAFELVAAQAEKNLRFLVIDRLIDVLKVTPIQPAVWKDGVRQSDRSEMLAALTARSPMAESRVVVLQPHHSEPMHNRLQGLARSGGTHQDLSRLLLIETLLNSARASAVGMGSDLLVWGRA